MIKGLKIYLDGFDDLPVRSREMEVPSPVDRMSIGDLKDRMESFFVIPRIFIEIQSGFWMCSGQRIDSQYPFSAERAAMFEVDRDGYIKVTVRESAARRWSMNLEKVKQRASLAEKQLFTLQTKLEEEKIRASETLRETRQRVDRLTSGVSPSDERDDLIEQTQLLKLSLTAANESAQSRIRVLEADLLSAKAAHEVAHKKLKETHVQELAEARRASVHQMETASRTHQHELDEQKERSRIVEDQLLHIRQKYQLVKTTKSKEISELSARIKDLESSAMQSQAKLKLPKAKSTRESGPSSPGGAGNSEETAKLTKKVKKLSEEMEEKEEELHAKQQLLRRVRFLVDQMSCIAEQKKK